jgi:hypothetical protein
MAQLTTQTPTCRNGHALTWDHISFGHGYCKCGICGYKSRADKPLLNDRLWAQSKQDVTTGCQLWTGTLHKDGYGQIKVNRKTRLAHIVSYELAIGLVGDGLELDHLCRVRRCIQPTHIEPVTNLVNIMRGHSPMAVALLTGFCQRGHEFTPENSIIKSSGGQKQCRACAKMTNHLWYVARRVN